MRGRSDQVHGLADAQPLEIDQQFEAHQLIGIDKDVVTKRFVPDRVRPAPVSR